MWQPDAQLKQAIMAFLRSHGLAVEEIPTSDQETPDLLVERGHADCLLVEVKTKDDDQAEIRDLHSRLKSGRVVERTKPTDAWNVLSGIIKKAVGQMTTHDPARASHHLLWFHSTGIDAPVTEVRLKATLYGTQKLVSLEVRTVITAYYYWNSAFHRFRESLDGVVISRENEAGLFLNPLSARLDALRSSKFVSIFGDPFLPDPTQTDIMVCGPDAPRGDESAMLAYLRQARALTHLQTMDMGFVSGWIES